VQYIIRILLLMVLVVTFGKLLLTLLIYTSGTRIRLWFPVYKQMEKLVLLLAKKPLELYWKSCYFYWYNKTINYFSWGDYEHGKMRFLDLTHSVIWSDLHLWPWSGQVTMCARSWVLISPCWPLKNCALCVYKQKCTNTYFLVQFHKSAW
jgi:hypothetical protein